MAKQTKLKDHLEQYDYQTRLSAHNNEAQESGRLTTQTNVVKYLVGLLGVVIVIGALLRVF